MYLCQRNEDKKNHTQCVAGAGTLGAGAAVLLCDVADYRQRFQGDDVAIWLALELVDGTHRLCRLLPVHDGGDALLLAVAGEGRKGARQVPSAGAGEPVESALRIQQLQHPGRPDRGRPQAGIGISDEPLEGVPLYIVAP